MELSNKDKNMVKECNGLNKKIHHFKNTDHVACLLKTKKGNKYFGVSIECKCGIGSCAENGAISSMVANGEEKIDTIVAIHTKNKKIIPPCGKCRELIYEVNKNNLDSNIIISKSKKVKLNDLLNYRWQENK